MTTCGKPNCRKCATQNEGVKGHGPYWYMCISMNGRWVRLYLGKILDTSRYRFPNGIIDWPWVKSKKRIRPTPPEPDVDHGRAFERGAAPGENPPT